MIYAKYLEPVEFVEEAENNHLKVAPRFYTLNNGMVGLVYTFYKENQLYYLNRFIPGEGKLEEYKKMNFNEVHNELALKINLEENLRKGNLQ